MDMRALAFALGAVSAIACVVVACSTEDEATPQTQASATCVLWDGTTRSVGMFACPGEELCFPTIYCSCNDDGTVGSSSYATDCNTIRGVHQDAGTDADAGSGDANFDVDVDDAADASADADVGAE